MKDRLGGKPDSVAKTWAARGKKKLQEIGNLRPKGKERQSRFFPCGPQPFSGAEEEGRIPEEGRPNQLSP